MHPTKFQSTIEFDLVNVSVAFIEMHLLLDHESGTQSSLSIGFGDVNFSVAPDLYRAMFCTASLVSCTLPLCCSADLLPVDWLVASLR